MIKLAGINSLSAFQWSTSEQVYPFEKGPAGETVYAKRINFGAAPAATSKPVNHNISSYTPSKLLFMRGLMYGASDSYPIPFGHPSGADIQTWTDSTQVWAASSYNYSTRSIIFDLAYYR